MQLPVALWALLRTRERLARARSSRASSRPGPSTDMLPYQPPEQPEPQADAETEAAEAYAADPRPDVDVILADKVLRWRCEQFLQLGMTLFQSRALAVDKRVDLHATRGLVGAGCDPTTAFDILS